MAGRVQAGAERGRVRALWVACSAAAAVVLVGCGLLGGCSSGDGGGASATSAASPGSGSADSVDTAVSPPSRTEDYLPGLAADVYLPSSSGARALVVLVPGGGWRSADREGLAPLASALATAGMTVVSVTYRTASTQTYFPGPLEDVDCAVAFAAARAVPAGSSPVRLVVVGHSAGADLAALATLAPQRLGPDCAYPAAAPDAFVGMSGPYDVTALPDVAEAFFGVSPREDPDLWADGDPLTYAGHRPEVPALLLHGRDDALVPVSFTTDFAAELRAGGHPVVVDLIAGAGHDDVYSVDVSAQKLIDWIGALP